MEEYKQDENSNSGQSTPPSEATTEGDTMSTSNSTDTDSTPDKVKESRPFAIIGYILPFLFFIPLLNDETKKDPFSKFHANQQLLILILIFGVSFLQGMITMVFMAVGYFLIQIFYLVILALAIFGAYFAHKGEMKPFPYIGKFKILK